MAQLIPTTAFEGSSFGHPAYYIEYASTDGRRRLDKVDYTTYRDTVRDARWDADNRCYWFDSDDPATDNPTSRWDVYGEPAL